MESIQGCLLMPHLVQMHSFPQISHPRQQMLDARTDFILSVTRHQQQSLPSSSVTAQHPNSARKMGKSSCPSHPPRITNSSRHQSSSTPGSSPTAPRQRHCPREKLQAVFGGGCGNHPGLPLSWLGWREPFQKPFYPLSFQPSASSRAQCSAPRWDDLEVNSGRWWRGISPLKFMPRECLLTAFWHQNKKGKKIIPTLWFSYFWRETQPSSVSRIKPKDQPSSDKLCIDFMLNSKFLLYPNLSRVS